MFQTFRMFDLEFIIPTKKFGTQLLFSNKTLKIQKMDSGIIQVTDLLERFILSILSFF